MESISEVKLEKLKAIVLAYVDENLVDFAIPATIELFEDRMVNSLILQLRQEVLGREMDRIECRCPADWRQAVKQRWLPAWAKRHWPVRERVTTMIARELYPKIALPHEEHYINLSGWDRLEDAT